MPRFDQGCTACPWMGEIWAKPDEHPPCPDCGEPTQRVWTSMKAANVIGDDIPGGMWMEHLGPEPIKVYSHSEADRIAKARGMERFVRHQPLQGSDKSPHTIDWSRGTDPQTLENARILVERQGKGHKDDPAPKVDVVFSIQPLDRGHGNT